MTHQTTEQRFETIVVGGGQAGLAVGYYLARRGRHFAIFDAGGRIGDAWRNRWDSLRLFTPAFHSGLPGLPFPAPGNSFPTKDETATWRRTRLGSPCPCASDSASRHYPGATTVT